MGPRAGSVSAVKNWAAGLLGGNCTHDTMSAPMTTNEYRSINVPTSSLATSPHWLGFRMVGCNHAISPFDSNTLART